MARYFNAVGQIISHLLNVVIAQGTSIFKLLAGEDQTLLIGRNAFFVLDLGFDVVDGVAGFDFEGDGFAREGFDEAGCVSGMDVADGGEEGVEGSLHLHCGSEESC